jgi:HEAT repeat protein
MRAFDNKQPNVKSLRRKGDVDGLIKAATYTELVPRGEGTPADVGAPIREGALLALREVALERAGDTFATALGDASDRVRCAAVLALYERGDSDLLAEAVARLPATAGSAREMAVRALFELHKPGSSRRLADALVHRHDVLPLSEEDEALLLALLRAEDRPDAVEEVVQLLISALAHADEVVSERASALLVRLGAASTDALVRELAGGAVPDRAATVLGDIKDPRALQPLVAALSHPDPRVRSQSCFALGVLRDPAAIEPLLQATRDPEHDVRVLAASALDGMGTAALAASVAALLRPMLSDSVDQGSVVRLLGSAGALPAREDRAAQDGTAKGESGSPTPNANRQPNSEPNAGTRRWRTAGH